ncbi:ComEC/Rec2 family competence protein [Domibacillus aminovorans]|uniref:Metallo-beta-lactamase domain-containing protein n=1 Tax=Domibacillus aminovorans TaxID=29332 RepID=A0A177L425_9BACI|nr:MBL fold metallo-hydrolase [Domibacillus aminovorans]OAH60112.1 hypothetical protein AWH49_18075 [Domibacillus aminovorans]
MILFLIIRKKSVMVNMILLLILSLSGCTLGNIGQMEIIIFKIGKADSILLSTANKNVLIDTGKEENGKEIIKYLEEHKIDTLDYLIITHFDKDHVGGADTVLKNVEVLNVVTADYTRDSKQYKEYVAALKAKNQSATLLTENLTFKLGSAEFLVYPPQRSHYSEDNDYSLVISVQHGENSFLFAGDAEETRLTELIEQGNLEHTFLKVPHHGLYTHKSADFFELVNPQYAVITCSDKNSEEKVVAALEQLGTMVYLTKNGDIYIKSDGNEVTIKQEDIK